MEIAMILVICFTAFLITICFRPLKIEIKHITKVEQPLQVISETKPDAKPDETQEPDNAEKTELKNMDAVVAFSNALMGIGLEEADNGKE